MISNRSAQVRCPGGGLFVIENEIELLMTAMRRGVRWSSNSYQDEDQDGLMKNLSSLKEIVNNARELAQIEPKVFISPFIEIIRSEETTGPVTSIALAAIRKFISYGLLDVHHTSIASCVEAIADAVTHARFVSTDASGDGVVFMRMLHVLRALVLAPCGDQLSNESICEIMLSCFRICFETRLTGYGNAELVRRTAEDCLTDMVQHLFDRLPQFTDIDTSDLMNMKKMKTNSIEATRGKSKKAKIYSKPKAKEKSMDDSDDTETQLMSPVERIKVGHLATTPITPGGNIVDMQGPLDPVVLDSKEPDKSNSEHDINKVENMKEIIDCSTNVDTEISILVNKENFDKTISTDRGLSKYSDNNSSTPNDNIDSIQSPTGSVENLSLEDNASIMTNKVPKSLQIIENQEDLKFIQPQHTPYGSLCIIELFRFLIDLCNPHDKQNTEIMTHLGLVLLQVSLEVAADILSNFQLLLTLVKDDLSRNLTLLLGSERISILAANLQVSFLLFESQREHLKFQMEQFINKLMDIINSESNRISYDQKELALQTLVRLWKVPGLPAELYLNYDCGLYSANLYGELMRLFSKNASVLIGNMYSIQFISLDAIFALVNGMEARCKGYTDILRPSRYKTVSSLPSRDELECSKDKKKDLAVGSDKFNDNPREGISKLCESGLLGGTLGNPDPEMIAKFLRENPTLDKKAIGEYLSKKENTNILHCFVHSFNFENTRIDMAVRQYMETFRLPGEAPLISMLLEKFADHWHDSNDKPFSSADAAFTLAYAIIMLNVDQHNHNVKRQINPMTPEEFKKNLKGINGGADFDQDMLDSIYHSIKNEEIIMPAEQTGLVKENYLWKCLLRRGSSPEGKYLKVGDSGYFIDKDLAENAWEHIIYALCRAYDKASDRSLQRKVAQTFLSCAAICAHYNMKKEMDTLMISLCKFTGLAIGGQMDQVILQLGRSGRCQLATRTFFKITHTHGNTLSNAWKNVVDCIQILFSAKLLPKNLTEGEDFWDSSGKVSLIRDFEAPKSPPADQGGILSSWYSFIALDSSKTSHPAEAEMKKRAAECIASCNIKQIIEESKFLELDALKLLINSIISVSSHEDENISVFLLEILLDVTIQNRGRNGEIWKIVKSYLEGLLTMSIRENHPYLMERVTVGMLRLAIQLLRKEEFEISNFPLMPLTYLPSASIPPLSRQITYGLFELLKIGAANIHYTNDWKVVFTLLECSGAGALQPKQIISTNEDSPSNISPVSMLEPRPSSPFELLSPTGTEAPLPVAADIIVLDREFQPHDPVSLIKSCESLFFLIRDMAHVTPYNFELCVRCIRTFVEAVLCTLGKRSRIHNVNIDDSMLSIYQQAPVKLLEHMFTLHTKIFQMFKEWVKDGQELEKIITDPDDIISSTLWPLAWRPLLQGIARLCCDSRRIVRTAAIAFLQSTLLAHDLDQLSGNEWSQCLEQVLFPLLAQLLGPVANNDPVGVEETRVRAAMLLSKVFLHHLNLLQTLSGFLPLWLTVLDLLRAYMHAENSELLYEAIPESLKNMLLVMASTGVLTFDSQLWVPTWRAIDGFLPNLKNEIFPEPATPQPTPSPPQSTPTQSEQMGTPIQIPHDQKQPIQPTQKVIHFIEQQQYSFPKPVPPQPEDVSSTASSPITSSSPPIIIGSYQKSWESVSQIYQGQSPSISPKADTYDTNLTSPTKSIIGNTQEKTQQLISLISQPTPSISSPIAIQPIVSQIFDSHQVKIQITNEIQETDIPSVPLAETHHSPKHLQSVSKVTDKISQYPEAMGSSSSSVQANKSEVPITDTTIFNPAAYFSEDTAADHLFVVTNPL